MKGVDMPNTRRTRRKASSTTTPVEPLTLDVVEQLADSVESSSVAVEDKSIQQTMTTETSKENSNYASKPNRTVELTALLQRYGTLFDARDVSAKYALVYNPVEYRGMWRVAGKKTIRLTDCHIQILRVVKPMTTSVSRDYSVTLRFTNPNDDTIELTLSRYDIDDDALSGQFLAFGSLPETPLHKQFLLEAIKELIKSDTILCQLQADALGWYRLQDDRLVWLLVNGVEESTGFLPANVAPFVAPTFISPGNGYYGDAVQVPDDSVMQLLLQELLPYGATLITSLLGLASRIMIPIPNDDTPGMLRFCSEIIGPPRHGKSRLLNAVLSLFGIRFLYDMGTLLNEHGGSDSKIGRLGLSSMMRFCLFSDFDHKVAPGHSLFDKIHSLRAATNNIYADDTGGGTVGTQKGGMRTRFKPTGGLVRTSNYDHAEYSLRHNEDNIEARVCSFVWPVDAQSDTGYQHASDTVSHQIEQQRTSIYSWGVYYRRWFMHMHNDTLTALVEEMKHQAKELVYPFTIDNDTWGCDLHRNQCVDMVLGLLMWRQFLVEEFPTSFMITWIDGLLPAIIRSRLMRCVHVHTVAGKFTSENKLSNFVLITVRYLLQSQQCYITTRNRLVQKDDTEYSLEKLGYKRVMRPGKQDNYEPGQHEVGCLTQDGTMIAFEKTAFYDALLREAERIHSPLPEQDTLIKQLADMNIVLCDKDNKSTFPVKYHGKTRRMVVIRLETIYPNDVDDSAIPFEAEDVADDIVPDNIRHLVTSPDTGNVIANF